MSPCAGLRELVLPERALIKREKRLYRDLKKNAESSRTRRDGISGWITGCRLVSGCSPSNCVRAVSKPRESSPNPNRIKAFFQGRRPWGRVASSAADPNLQKPQELGIETTGPFLGPASRLHRGPGVRGSFGPVDPNGPKTQAKIFPSRLPRMPPTHLQALSPGASSAALVGEAPRRPSSSHSAGISPRYEQ